MILTCYYCCCILLIHRISPVSSDESDPVIRIRTQGSPSSPSRSVTDEDLEFSDTSHGEVTNSDQQVVYINHGGGAVSSIRRSFAVPFTPHVSSYPTTLFEGSNNQAGAGNSDPDVGPEYRRDVNDAGFARRAGGDADEDRPFEGNFDDHNLRTDSFAPDVGDHPVTHEPGITGHQPIHPSSAPLGLPVPPTSFGSRTSGIAPLVNHVNHNTNPVSNHRLHDHRIAEPDQRNARINFPPAPKPFNQPPNPITGRNNNNNNNNHPPNMYHNSIANNNNINRVNPLLNAFSPIASGFPQALNPDFFSLFDAPFAPIGAAGFPPPVTNSNNNNNDNLFQRRRLSVQNAPNNEISHNSLVPVAGYPNYNYYAGNEEGEAMSAAKWPKIFKFSDGRINLYEFEKDKKIGRIKFSKDEDPLFDGVRRDSFLILHGGTYR